MEVDAVGFGDSSIDLVVRYWTHPEKREVRQTQSRVMLALKKACNKAGISIPYPIRSVYSFDQNQFSDNEAQGTARKQMGATSWNASQGRTESWQFVSGETFG
ncbi:MAG: hypothetical protein ACFCBU_09310 [Cyanophyceae cyanobacterium]